MVYIFTKYNVYFTLEQVNDILISTKLYNGDLPEPDLKAGCLEENLPDWFQKSTYF